MEVAVTCIYSVIVGFAVPMNILSEKRWVRVLSLLAIAFAIIIRCWFVAEKGI